MPVSPSVLKSIRAIRKAIAEADGKSPMSLDLDLAVDKLFQQSGRISADIETLATVLDFGKEIEAFRGKGSQSAALEFSKIVYSLVRRSQERLPPSKISPECLPRENELRMSEKNADVLACLELLANHAFARTKGPPVRSHHAGDLRVWAWEALAMVADVLRRPEHIDHALNVSNNERASSEERWAARRFLERHWDEADPDELAAHRL